jgi:hypothetical protein
MADRSAQTVELSDACEAGSAIAWNAPINFEYRKSKEQVMDDLPDKLRRNVVVLSAVIVAITVFHLSFKPTGTLLGFAEVGNVTPLKVWLTLSAVLVYVFLRYWFHDDTDADRQALAGHYKGLQLVAGFDGDRLPIGRRSGLENLDDGNQR